MVIFNNLVYAKLHCNTMVYISKRLHAIGAWIFVGKGDQITQLLFIIIIIIHLNDFIQIIFRCMIDEFYYAS